MTCPLFSQPGRPLRDSVVSRTALRTWAKTQEADWVSAQCAMTKLANPYRRPLKQKMKLAAEKSEIFAMARMQSAKNGHAEQVPREELRT